MGLAGCVASMGEIKNSYKILDTKPEGKRSLREHRHRWDGNIKIKLNK
jgi:hypothetical protein